VCDTTTTMYQTKYTTEERLRRKRTGKKQQGKIKNRTTRNSVEVWECDDGKLKHEEITNDENINKKESKIKHSPRGKLDT